MYAKHAAAIAINILVVDVIHKVDIYNIRAKKIQHLLTMNKIYNG
jgi:hypothetical protein